LFASLRERGIVPAWDTPIKELQRLANAPATHLQREQVVSCNAPATAIPTPTPTPTPKETPPNPRKRGQGSPEGFERFWQAWPAGIRKVAKAQCLRRWQAAGCEAFTDRVLASVRDHKASADWLKDGGAFIPAPLVWLNQSRWEAVLEPAPSASLIASGEAERERQRQQAVIAVPTPAWAKELATKLKRAG
jgi:hypothetical protein